MLVGRMGETELDSQSGAATEVNGGVDGDGMSGEFPWDTMTVSRFFLSFPFHLGHWMTMADIHLP